MTEAINTGHQPSAGAVDEAIDYTQRLVHAIQKTEEEFGKLPVFIRPIARNYFKDGAGQSVDDWNQELAQLNEKLQAIKSADNNARVWLHAGYPDMKTRLDKLYEFFGKAPALVKGFTSDADTVRRAESTALEYGGVVKGLIHALDQI